jgi:hypothetical protein
VLGGLPAIEDDEMDAAHPVNGTGLASRHTGCRVLPGYRSGA